MYIVDRLHAEVKIVALVWLVVVPKSTPEVVSVMPSGPSSAFSQVSTGTPTFVNFVFTSPEVTVDEMTTRSLPVASALVAAVAAFTVTE